MQNLTAPALIPQDHFTLHHDGQVISDTVIETRNHVREGLIRIDGYEGSYTVPQSTEVTIHN
jgi:hypothetical protein